MPIEGVEITDEQAGKAEAWLAANASVPGWLGGYALGAAYVDPRAAGRGLARRKAYARLDTETAAAVPELRGRDAAAIRAFLEERRPAAPAPGV